VTTDILLDAKRVLVLAPHPDDESLGCGGTIALCAARGAEVHVAVISDGGKISPGDAGGLVDIVDLRKGEAREASGILGVKEISFLGYPDGDLKGHAGRIKADIAGLVDRFQPEIVLSPSPLDYHEDHIAVAKIAAEIASRREGLSLALFQVYGTLRFNSLVDIGSVLEMKESAIRCYRHSLFDDPELFAEAVRGASRFWSFYCRARGYYEAFFIVPTSCDLDAIIGWLTYGEKGLKPEEIFLGQLKAVDELLFEVKKMEGLLAAKDAERKALEAEVESKGKTIAQLLSDRSAQKDELALARLGFEDAKKQIGDMTGSIFWRVATAFYRIRDRLLPVRSLQRRIYDKLVGRIKGT
jgi:LmbE family N-acetylglucosaminyl deacetylase